MSKNEVTVFDTESLVFSSECVGKDLSISVALPRNYSEKKSYPVIYVLDGDGAFTLVESIIRPLMFSKEMPEALIVAIGYGLVPGTDEMMARRALDLTPTRDHNEEMDSGGGKEFLDFITDELMPLINERYRSDPDNCTLAGHSFGGLFAFYTMFTRTDSFNRYVSASPSIWWDDEVLRKYEENFRGSETPVYLYLAIGGREKRVALFKDFTAGLTGEKYGNFRITSEVIRDSEHLSMLPVAYSFGFRAVFQK